MMGAHRRQRGEGAQEAAEEAVPQVWYAGSQME